MRTYVPGTWEIDKERYMELLHYCWQYPRWKLEAASMIGVSGASMEATPHGSDPGDPTARTVERREQLLRHIELVERCAAAIDSGRWYQALILNVCNRMPWETLRDLHPDMLRSSNRSAYFRAKRMFFNLLSKERD